MSKQGSRRGRRRRYTQTYTAASKADLPGPLRILSHPRVFTIVGIIFAAAIVGGLLYGAIGSSRGGSTQQQANEAPDQPTDAENATTPLPAVTPTARRFDAPPPMTIDLTKAYVATIRTDKGEITIMLDSQAAPAAVNSFVFLARQGYYDGTPFMEIAKNPDGTPFAAQAGDPTRTGLGTPGYSIAKEATAAPFDKGAVGMGGSSATSNGGQFFISFGDYPALTGKYTIFGRVISGMDVLSKLSLLDPSKPAAAGDEILSVSISES